MEQDALVEINEALNDIMEAASYEPPCHRDKRPVNREVVVDGTATQITLTYACGHRKSILVGESALAQFKKLAKNL